MDRKRAALRFGRFGEWSALALLWCKGYRLRHRNWHGGGGELDLIMDKGAELVFIEVRSRSHSEATLSVGRRKQEHLIRAAKAYMSRFHLWDRPCRFDIVSVERQAGGWMPRLEHHEDAFRPGDFGRI